MEIRNIRNGHGMAERNASRDRTGDTTTKNRANQNQKETLGTQDIEGKVEKFGNNIQQQRNSTRKLEITQKTSKKVTNENTRIPQTQNKMG